MTRESDKRREAQAIESVALSDYVALATGDRSVTNEEARAVVEWCADYARDCVWQDADSDDIRESAESAPMDLLRACHRTLQDGLRQALDSVRSEARDNARALDNLRATFPTAMREEAPALTIELSSYQHATVICALVYYAHACADPTGCIEALSVVAPTAVDTLKRQLGIEAPTNEAQCPHCGNQSPTCHCA